MRWEGHNHLHVQDHRDVADVDAGRVARGGRHLAGELPPLGRVHVARGGAAAAIAPVARDLRRDAHDPCLLAVRPAHPHGLARQDDVVDEVGGVAEGVAARQLEHTRQSRREEGDEHQAVARRGERGADTHLREGQKHPTGRGEGRGWKHLEDPRLAARRHAEALEPQPRLLQLHRHRDRQRERRPAAQRRGGRRARARPRRALLGREEMGGGV